MYLPTKMCPSRPYTERFSWQAWSKGTEGHTSVYQPNDLLCSQRRTRYGMTFSTC
ncbi:hypothetical protein NP493_754g00003 [Ridgeia piscesae]|uniref:Uncharacterized protein n=1 Tax=Ridgeia piscesae TaxID=27915 RepID=A0AAD9KP30_RIDPI|nr:hypothetical protein NP493_754g00003 [Ridgeia piscesae]